jgi:hypothetical protein
MPVFSTWVIIAGSLVESFSPIVAICHAPSNRIEEFLSGDERTRLDATNSIKS